MSTPEWLTIPEVAEAWRCSGESVLRRITLGELVATKVGGKWLISPADKEAFERAHSNVQKVAPRVRRPRRRAAA